MIGYLQGTVSHLFGDYCFLNVGGVGYRIFTPLSTLTNLSVGQSALLFTSLQVREDAMLLYGFLTQAEYDLFIHLTSVSGIGPKVAVGVLSSMRPSEFQLAIGRKDIALLTKIPGIGKKTAERLILELKDKMGTLESNESGELSVGAQETDDDLMGQALAALTVLGYSQSESLGALKKVSGNGEFTLEKLIKMALRDLSGR